MKNGVFTVSLDFELYWGVFDSKRVKDYGKNILGSKDAVSELLRIFKLYGIRATWGVVGFVYFENFEELRENLPPVRPSYDDKRYSSYERLKEFEKMDERLFFAPDSVKEIAKEETQEIASHTFSHYYCLEKGQNEREFYYDLLYSKEIALKKIQRDLKSIIFPRDQLNVDYVPVLKKLGFKAYRGNPNHFIYRPVDQRKKQGFVRKALLFADTYMNITGLHAHEIDTSNALLNIPSSRFLRPVSKRFSYFEKMRLNRIKKQMEFAAKEKKLFHLWWHPHNFGVNLKENIAFLEEILIYFKELSYKYSMLSLSVSEASDFAKKYDKEKGFENEKSRWICGLQ